MSTHVEAVTGDRWLGRVTTALADGGRFIGAWATGDGGWRLAIAEDGSTRVLTCATEGRPVASIIELAGGADWDEREAHDLYGLELEGRPAPRPLVHHPADPAAWVTPVVGDGVHQVAVGPIHAGVIESGHFRFHCVGERVLAMDPRLFHKHRGLERAAEGGDLARAAELVGRACAACSVANGLAFAHAVEDALGLWLDGELRRQRTVLLELERVWNHLNDIGAICAGVGFAAGTMAFASLKDRTQELLRAAFGHRFLFGTIAVGSGTATLGERAATTLREGLAAIAADAAAAWRDLSFTAPVQARLGGVGVLSREEAVRFGVVGPAARASGVALDARVTGERRRRLAYPVGLRPAAPVSATGDVAARLEMRPVELQETFAMLDELLGGPLGAGACAAAGPGADGGGPGLGGSSRSGGRSAPGGSSAPSGSPGSRSGGGGGPVIGIGRVESARGETMCAVELEGMTVARVHLRTSSYANWPALARTCEGALLPDFPLINKSFELCYACVDR